MSNDNGERTKSPTLRAVIENLRADIGGGGKRSYGDKGDGQSDSWAALDDMMGQEVRELAPR